MLNLRDPKLAVSYNMHGVSLGTEHPTMGTHMVQSTSLRFAECSNVMPTSSEDEQRPPMPRTEVV